MAQTILVVDDEAHVRTMLREYLTEQGFRVETAADGRQALFVARQAVDLTPTEFELLATLMAAPGRVYARAQLLEKLHRFALEGIERTIDVHIRNLRAKIEPDPGAPRYIETVFGVGYRFAEN